jgi:hypothetical protein
MAGLQGWKGIAYNQASESENRIHSDEVARRYGFRGGLVPGISVYAYLVQPAVVTWGREWLERGTASVVLRKPLYDGGAFRTEIEREEPTAYRGEVLDADGVLCADGRVTLPEAAKDGPARRGDPPACDWADRPEASREATEELRDQGLGAFEIEWTAEGDFDRYTKDLEPMPDLIRPDRGGFANPAFTLGLANWVLVANMKLGAWIHAESQVRNHAAIPRGARLVVEGQIRDLFERSGHEFVDLDVAVFIKPDTPALSASHRALYRLRGS